MIGYVCTTVIAAIKHMIINSLRVQTVLMLHNLSLILCWISYVNHIHLSMAGLHI